MALGELLFGMLQFAGGIGETATQARRVWLGALASRLRHFFAVSLIGEARAGAKPRPPKKPRAL